MRNVNNIRKQQKKFNKPLDFLILILVHLNPMNFLHTISLTLLLWCILIECLESPILYKVRKKCYVAIHASGKMVNL